MESTLIFLNNLPYFRKYFPPLIILQIQKRIVSAETIRGNTVFDISSLWVEKVEYWSWGEGIWTPVYSILRAHCRVLMCNDQDKNNSGPSREARDQAFIWGITAKLIVIVTLLCNFQVLYYSMDLYIYLSSVSWICKHKKLEIPLQKLFEPIKNCYGKWRRLFSKLSTKPITALVVYLVSKVFFASLIYKSFNKITCCFATYRKVV